MNLPSFFLVSVLIAAPLLTHAEVSNSERKPKGITCIDADAAAGSSKAVVVEPAVLAHTTQLFPINKEGKIVGKDDVATQTKQVLENIGFALRAGQSSLDAVVKLNICIRSNEFRDAVTKVLASTVSGAHKPAVTFVAGGLAHPDALIAMDAVGVSTAHDVRPITYRSGKLQPTPRPHVATLPADGAVYVAGMADKGEITEATRKTLEKLDGAIQHLGLNRHRIVQLKAFLDPISDAGKVQDEIDKFFKPDVAPPVVFVEWVASGVPIEIELIAAAGEQKDKTNSISYITPPGTTASPVYSRVAQVNFGKRIYISGLYGTGTAENDVKEIYSQLQDVAQKAGTDFNHLAKATYYFSDPKSNGRLDAFRPTVYNPKTPPAASKARVKDVGMTGKGITVDMIAGQK